jgi:hypothetical protein
MRIWRLRSREWLRRRDRGERMSEETVGSLAELYLGNLLYALELAAMSLEQQEKPTDAAFYRGIARKLAEARGREVGGTKG